MFMGGLVNTKRGRLIQNGVHLEDHEYRTVRFLLDSGYDVELIPPMQIKGMNTPDIQVDGMVWELKSPTGNGKNTMKHNISNAKRQSRNVIVDLRRCKMPEERSVNELKHHFDLSKRLKRLRIIKKSEIMLDFSK